jgi:hypothetical protein
MVASNDQHWDSVALLPAGASPELGLGGGEGRPTARARASVRPSVCLGGEGRAAGTFQMQELVAERRRALSAATLEPGLGCWLARQRWLWRHGRWTASPQKVVRPCDASLAGWSTAGWQASVPLKWL